ncbi:Pericentrin-AKAP-450 domain of centrosomal targeting protein-domain-containing protein, partial [Paraphysoderma sedebokerense]
MNKQIQHERQIEGVESLKEDIKGLREQLLQNGIKSGERRNDDVKRLELEIMSLKQEQKKLNANVKKERISVEAHLRLHEDVQRKLEEKDRELRNLILTQSQRRHDPERTDQRHSKEQQIKIMSKEIQYLKAKYRKETGFRADLIYQKKYLLMLIGGLEACEKATWMLITNTGVASGKAVPSSFSNGLTRFRKAVFAVIAIERMSTLRRKWLAQRKLKTETVNSGILNGDVGHSLGMSQLSINQTLHPESYARHSVSTNLDIYDLQKSVINLQSRLNRHNTNS